MNPTNVPVPVSFADQTSLAFQAVASGRLRSVQVIPRRVAKPRKAARATAAPRPAVASGRVTKKRGTRTARVETPVQAEPAVPQGTAVPPPPSGKFTLSMCYCAELETNKETVPAAPQGIETPLSRQPLSPRKFTTPNLGSLDLLIGNSARSVPPLRGPDFWHHRPWGPTPVPFRSSSP